VGRVRHNNEDYVSAEWVLSADGAHIGLWLVADGVAADRRENAPAAMAVETVIDFVVHEKWVDPAGALTAAFRARQSQTCSTSAAKDRRPRRW